MWLNSIFIMLMIKLNELDWRQRTCLAASLLDPKDLGLAIGSKMKGADVQHWASCTKEFLFVSYIFPYC